MRDIYIPILLIGSLMIAVYIYMLRTDNQKLQKQIATLKNSNNALE